MMNRRANATDKLIGRWRIIEMDNWDREEIDALEPSFITFSKGMHGEFAFIAAHGWMDCRPIEWNGHPGVEFTWEGNDDGDPVHGRGWVALVDDDEIEGHIYIHLGENSGFRAKPYDRFSEKEY
ncbi:hypothetical protein OK351_07765 [Glutamicibacter sp. MNS18]|uniref:hypothetical protein n=1 Tax=Glutamicibacter sp. MNS18 TaxID=2989817 RepID=UPI0022364541|nr:hypothetical protein [Glutamicibacter sp. MNS18]MCW4465396.1 hypothetical protein [Glutamicibacter sp. MNS18]